MMLPKGVQLVQTCGACPEQYDMFLHGELVGYFRLRHSWYTVEMDGDFSGVRISENYYPGEDAGIFYPEDRDEALSRGVKAVLDRVALIRRILTEDDYIKEERFIAHLREHPDLDALADWEPTNWFLARVRIAAMGGVILGLIFACLAAFGAVILGSMYTVHYTQEATVWLYRHQPVIFWAILFVIVAMLLGYSVDPKRRIDGKKIEERKTDEPA